VSHDRYFLDRVATSILVFEGDGRVVRYPGNYSTYLSLRPVVERPRPQSQSRPPPAPKVPRKGLTHAERIELEGILDVIAGAEARIAALEKALASPEVYASKTGEAKKVGADLDAARAELERLTARWESLESRAAAAKA
jgi:ATP-binding cassette subfamily F protein uup